MNFDPPEEIDLQISDALAQLPLQYVLAGTRVEVHVKDIWFANCAGQLMETQRLPSRADVKDTLRVLADRCSELALQLETLNPAIGEALTEASSPDLARVSETLIDLRSTVEFVLAEGLEDFPHGGNPGKWRAKLVTNSVGKAYRDLTGRSAGFSSDSATSERSGPFIDLLGKVFAALGIEASAQSQAVAFKSKNSSTKNTG